MTPLEIRHAAIEATMAKYRHAEFQWGKVDCAKVAAFHLRQVGHKLSISKAGPYQSATGAARALKKLGYSTLPEMADGLGLAQIPHSRLLLGDLAELPGDSPLGTICIYAGNGKVFGFHEDHPGLVAMTPVSILRAWSVL